MIESARYWSDTLARKKELNLLFIDIVDKVSCYFVIFTGLVCYQFQEYATFFLSELHFSEKNLDSFTELISAELLEML